MEQERVSTGISGLDDILRGGFVRGLSYLVRGGPGTGKTQVGLHFLTEGARRGERVLFVSLEHTRDLLETAVASLPFDFEQIPFVSLVAHADSGQIYSLFSPADVEQDSLMKRLTDAIEEYRPERLFVDGFSQLRLLSPNEFQFRRQVLSFLAYAHRGGITAVVSSEAPNETGDIDLQFMSHGIVTVRLDVEQGRSIEVSKSLASGYAEGRHALTLDADGVHVFPRLVASEHGRDYEIDLAQTGIGELDTLLGGGLERGTITLISGPNGVGKTTIAIQLLLAAAQRGEKAVMYALEEERDQVLKRAEGVGQPLREFSAKGLVDIEFIEPLALTADEFSWRVRDKVNAGASMLMIDSLTGYRLTLKGGEIVSQLHALSKYLQRMGVTVLLLNEMEKIIATDLSVTDLGVSYLADNIMLLRYMEVEGRLERSMAVLKKRLGDFEKTLRQYQITSDGVVVGEPLTAMRGVLTGIPEKLE